MGRYPNVVWAPNGEKLAISYEIYGNALATQDWTDILSLSSESIQSLSSGAPADWSPDGQWIITIERSRDENGADLPNTINVVNVKSGEIFPIAEGIEAVWQPSPGVTETQPNTAEVNPQSVTLSTALDTNPTLTPLSGNALCTASSISLEDTTSGNFLHLCANGQEYQIGPLENGAYAMGPNGKFFIYCTNSGIVYAARVGDTNLTSIGKVKDFSIIKRGEAPQYQFVFLGDNPYSVQIVELILGQNKTVPIPSYITASN